MSFFVELIVFLYFGRKKLSFCDILDFIFLLLLSLIITTIFYVMPLFSLGWLPFSNNNQYKHCKQENLGLSLTMCYLLGEHSKTLQISHFNWHSCLSFREIRLNEATTKNSNFSEEKNIKIISFVGTRTRLMSNDPPTLVPKKEQVSNTQNWPTNATMHDFLLK